MNGEIYCYGFGCRERAIQSGISPALVAQANDFSAKVAR